MASLNRILLWFVLVVHQLSFYLLLQVDGTVINIYSWTTPNTVLANLSRPGWTNHVLHTPELDEPSALQTFSVDSSSGLVRMIRKPDCNTLRHNPFTVFVESTSIFNSSERTLRPMSVTVFGEKCFLNFRRTVKSTSPVGTRVFSLGRILTYCERLFIDPASLKLRNNPERRFFRFGAKSDYLVLRKSLLEVKENVLKVDIVSEFPASKYGGRNKQTIIARIEFFVDDSKANFFNKVRRFRRVIQFSPPRFSSTDLTAPVSEDARVGTTVTTIQAQDTNNGYAGKITYRMEATQNLLSQTFFSINSDTGLIKTVKSLDRESMSEHFFNVYARYEEHRSLYASAYLRIVVGDINDNAPKFESPSYSEVIPENVNVGYVVIDVRAEDKDEGKNADIRYAITNWVGVNRVFKIHESSGAIFVDHPLDRETVPQYSLTIQASDQGSPPKTDQTTVRITVTDVNDCAPQFSKKEYRKEIREDIKPGNLVLTINATDKDTGSNGEVEYSFTSGNDQGLFSINRLNGQIKVIKSLDYEYTPVHTLFVMAQDKGETPQYNETSVEIELIDVNDNAPQFPSADFQETVSERENVQHTFTRIQAFDDDQGVNQQIVYSLFRTNLPFGINSQTGDLFLTKKLDRETQDRYEFRIKAQDRGTPPKSSLASVTVTVGDVNDNPPKFSQPVYEGSVEENAKLGRTILQVTATDPDLTQRDPTYRLDPHQPRCFRISSRGVITLICRLDYSKKKFFLLTVKARDNLLESSAIVRINITDSNTHPPIFKQRIYQKPISEATAKGVRVLFVKATDDDQGLNAKITYAFERPQRDFNINPDTGEITVANSLDRESTPQYRFDVSATDHGNPRLKGTANVHITVTDVNDNEPRFLQSNYGKEIKEDVRPGTKVLVVSAVDDDDGSNKAIIYSFARNGDGGGAFQIDSTQGVIRTLLRLDRETIPVYQLTVVAADKGRPSLSSSVKVKITLKDVRDSPPKFTKDPYIVFKREDIKERSDVVKVEAVSQDDVSQTGGYPIVYSIISGNDPLTFIIQRNGMIQTKTKLDYEKKSEYILKVRATSSPYFVETIVNVTLIDVNDNPPVLQNFVMVINIIGDKFPKQPYFKIPAYDPDVSDHLTYESTHIEQGAWVALNRSTGELRVSPTSLNTGKTINVVKLKVKVSDSGSNTAIASGQVIVTSVTPEMLKNSLTLDIYGETIQEFFHSSYVRLGKAIANVISCDLDQLKFFHITSKLLKAKRPREDDISQLKVWFAVYKLDSIRNRVSFYDPGYVRDLIFINMTQISEEAKLKLLPFEDNLCVKEVCNRALVTSRVACMAYANYTGESNTYSSTTVVFRTVGVQEKYRCSCAPYYRSRDCDKVLNLCYSNPCQDQGKCVSVEGNYSCICNPGRTGRNCEIQISKSKCPSDSKTFENNLKLNPCRNGGNCKDSSSGGFSCVCRKEYPQDGKFCELTTRSFKKGTYVAFPALKQRWLLHIKLEFTTTEHSGLLLYNGRYDGKHDFIAVLVIKGQVQFRFSVFSQTIAVTSNINGGVADGKWHKVEVSFLNRTGIIIVDDCKLAVAVKFGTRVGSFSCAAAQRVDPKVEADNYKSLDLTGPLLLGGSLPLPTNFPVPYKHFTGCIANVAIDHVFLDLSRPMYVNGTTAGCPGMQRDYCTSRPCQRGNCSSILKSHRCDCPSGYGGRSCQTAVKYTQRFLSQSYIRMIFTSKVNLPWKFSLRFRTAVPSGTLVETSFKSSVSSLLEVVNGKLSYNYNELLVLQVPHVAVNDTKWHHVEILWTYNSLLITVDYIYQVSAETSYGADLGEVEQFFIGARKNSTKSAVYGGFRGCMQGVSVGTTEININQGQGHNIASGCESQMPTHCSSNPCPSYSTCKDTFDSYECVCPSGYVGRHCVDVCSLTPCRHGQCIRIGSGRGFKCVCPRQYTGEYCEVLKETPCQDGLFGDPNIGICGPCMCDVGMNLSPVCNKTTGECYCKQKHYRKFLSYIYSLSDKKTPVYSDECYKCNCEDIGSTGEDCEVKNGQCPCQKGKGGAKDVVGRRCDTCQDRQGEIIRARGCVVINTSCPRAFAEDIWWRKADFGKLSEENCPFGSTGKASRFCDKDDGWQKPSLVDCVSNSFLALQKQLANLTSGLVNWDTDFALGVANAIELAITLSPRLYAKDVEIALKIITTLFDYESQQNSSTLVSARTNEFAKVLLQSASMLFSSDNKDVWDYVQQHSAGTAALLQQMENFSGNLASSLPYLKRKSHRARRDTDKVILPYTILTPNIVMELHPVFVNGFEGFSYPAKTDLYSDGQYKIWRNISSRVDIPKTFFKDVKGIDNDLGIGFMIIRNIGDLLPKSFDAKIRDTKYNVEVTSDVITVNLPEMESMPLNDPVQIFFANRLVNRSSYICVHWNYSVPNTRGGGWSRDGCELKSSNISHTVCACKHMTAFAVLSDLNLQYPEEAAFAMQLVTYVGISVSLFLLLVAFILFILIRKLNSNSVTIHKNLIVAVFIAELTFLVGINRTTDQRICKLVAICLHYFFCASFSWMFVEGLHMYRRLREMRNIDTGKMSFYYFMGWGCPAIVIGISAGLASEGYGNKKFCWMSTDGTLIWTFTIPIIIVVALNTLVFIMALFISLQKQSRKRRRRHHHHHDNEHPNLNAGLRATAGLLPLIGVSFALGLLLVNQELAMFHYIFAGFTFSQGLFIFLFYLLLDKTVRKEFKNVYMRWKTGDKTYGLQKPTQHFKRSYHPGEMAPLRTPYDFDDEGNATSTSTTEPSSSGFRSSITSRYTTEDGTDTLGDEDTSVPDGEVVKKSKYPDNPELELARKIWEQPDKSEASTTQPESSSEEEEERPSSRGIASDSSDSEDENVPSKNGWPKDKTPKRRKNRKAPFYASDGPMHSTPMETTPEEEPSKEAEGDSSSDTGDEDIPTVITKKERASFKTVPEIIQDKGVSGSAATSDTAPSAESTLKKPLKSALKKPKNPVPPPVVLDDEDGENTQFSPSDQHHHHHHHRHHKDKHRHRHERPRSRASSASSDPKDKKRRFRRRGSKKKETLVQIGGEEYRVTVGHPTDSHSTSVTKS